MYIIFVLALACLLGWLIWKGLNRTQLPHPVRMVLTLVGTVLITVLAYWGLIYLSIFIFLWNDPITW